MSYVSFYVEPDTVLSSSLYLFSKYSGVTIADDFNPLRILTMGKGQRDREEYRVNIVNCFFVSILILIYV